MGGSNEEQEYALLPKNAPLSDSEEPDDDWEGDDAAAAQSYVKRSHASSIFETSWGWKRVVIGGAAFLFLCLLVAGAAHPVSRDIAKQGWHRLPFGNHGSTRPYGTEGGKDSVLDKLPRVERNASLSLREYFDARFDPKTDVVMWTMATGAYPSYVPNARNWELKRAELGMGDSVVILCLDEECLDECERTGLRAHAAYVKNFNKIPPPSQRSRLARRGAERGHVLAYLKFKAMLEMAQSGYYSLFFEGDTFLSDDPFKYMLKREDDTWDVQFTEDIGYLLNFGWIYARPSQATVDFYQHAYDQYVAHNQWDQELLSNMVRTLGGHEWSGNSGKEHWWLCDQIGLRLYMLPLTDFYAFHVTGFEWYFLPEGAKPVMNHLTAMNYANRQFYPKERGWAANVDAFYTTPRPVLTGQSIDAEIHAAAHYARLLHVLAVRMGWALQVPSGMTVHGKDDDGTEWTYTRDWTRFVSLEAAVNNHLDLLENEFFTHAGRYLPANVVNEWSDQRTTIDLTKFSSIDELVAKLTSLNVSDTDGRVIELTNYDHADSSAASWNLNSTSVKDVAQLWREIPLCQNFHKEHIPFPWCLHLPLSFA
ncbi:hypothetical protein JCM10908_003298 [Rhodotorula pacifica]|uniref:uncharacterized protein n=1 Tax=Rhodotorula pacifica TaxID=1495444 RepID=UPI003171F8C7